MNFRSIPSMSHSSLCIVHGICNFSVSFSFSFSCSNLTLLSFSLPLPPSPCLALLFLSPSRKSLYQLLIPRDLLSYGIGQQFPPNPEVTTLLYCTLSCADFHEECSRSAHSKSLLVLRKPSSTFTLDFFPHADHRY